MPCTTQGIIFIHGGLGRNRLGLEQFLSYDHQFFARFKINLLFHFNVIILQH